MAKSEHPKVFISYAWEDNTKIWVHKFASLLRSHGVDTILDRIAERYGFSYVAKYTQISLFKNQYNEVVIAWHGDNDRNESFSERGFDTSSKDLIEDYWREGVISNSEYRDIFYQFSEIPAFHLKFLTAHLNQ